MGVEELKNSLKEVETAKKKGELSPTEFYSKLLDIVERIKEEIDVQSIEETTIKKQIPLLLSFIKNQIREMEKVVK